MPSMRHWTTFCRDIFLSFKTLVVIDIGKITQPYMVLWASSMTNRHRYQERMSSSWMIFRAIWYSWNSYVKNPKLFEVRGVTVTWMTVGLLVMSTAVQMRTIFQTGAFQGSRLEYFLCSCVKININAYHAFSFCTNCATNWRTFPYPLESRAM